MLLKTENLTLKFGGLVANNQVNIMVEEGSITGLIGPNGAGKTTLFNLINGVYAPTSGEIYFDGKRIDGCKPYQVNRAGICRTYQIINLFKKMTVLENVMVGMHTTMKSNFIHAILKNKSEQIEEKKAREEAYELLKFVGIENQANNMAGNLSYGQQRLLEIVRAMASKPKLIMLDEPAAGLDPEGRDEILSEVKEYHKKTGTTVLLVSHSMEDIAKYADRVLVMSNKKIAMYDTVENVFARAPELLALGLSVPQVTKIFLKLREMGVDVPADVYTVPYAVKMILEAKKRRDAGESLVLPRVDAKKGGAATC